MTEQTIDLKNADAELRDVLSRFQPGTVVVLKDGDSYVGKIVVYDQPAERPKRTLGLNRGLIRYMAEDFDAPLPDEFWLSGNP